MPDQTEDPKTPAEGATPEAKTPEGETPESTIEKPETKVDSPEEIARKLANKTAEAARLHKQLEAREEADRKKELAAMTESDRLKAENAELKKKEEARALKDLQIIAAKAAGLPEDLAERLKGATPEEIEADAKALAATLPKPAPEVKEKKTVVKATAPETAEKVQKTEAEFRAEVFGNPANIFDPKFARDGGGGVFSSDQGVKQTPAQKSEDQGE